MSNRPINRAISEELKHIASCVNFACYTGNQSDALKAMRALYLATDGYAGKKLLQIIPDDAQPIGLGYTWFATKYINGDGKQAVNEVAAENAILCFGISNFESGNRDVLTAVFSLLNDKRDLLDDAYERVLKETWYYGPLNRQGYSKYKISGNLFYKYSIMYYCLNSFYNFTTGKISSSAIYFRPSETDIVLFLNSLKNSSLWGRSDLLELGKQNFQRLYHSIYNFIENL